MAQEVSIKSVDKLNLGNDEGILSLLKKEGISGEKVIFSDKLTKINRKGKKQDRVLMITNKALYNLKYNKYAQSQRRIELKNIGMITLSKSGYEFAIHVPSEYDYHFASKNQQIIAQLIVDLYKKDTGAELLVVQSELKHLKDIILTQKLAKYEVNK